MRASITYAIIGTVMNDAAQASPVSQIIIEVIAGILVSIIIWVYRNKIIKALSWLVAKVKAPSVYFYKDHNLFFRSFQSAVQTSYSLDILVIMGLDFTNNKTIPGIGVNSYLGRLLTQNDDLRVRVLIMNPDSAHVIERAKEINRGVSHVRNGIITALNNLKEIQNRHETLEVRLYDRKPIWRLVNTDNGTYMGFYQSKRSYDNHFYYIHRKNDSLFKSFLEYFEMVWNAPETQRVSRDEISTERMDNNDKQ